MPGTLRFVCLTIIKFTPCMFLFWLRVMELTVEPVRGQVVARPAGLGVRAILQPAPLGPGWWSTRQVFRGRIWEPWFGFLNS